jgi:hypothetical protein
MDLHRIEVEFLAEDATHALLLLDVVAFAVRESRLAPTAVISMTPVCEPNKEK